MGAPALRLPEWARKGDPLSPRAHGLRVLLREQGLNTVCEEARCPNLSECFARGTATFMLLGDRCTRRCGYCSVQTARPLPPDAEEPRRVAEAAARMDLRYVVLTSVARDDLQDGGASHFAATVAEVRQALPAARVEVLTPDFKGQRSALAAVLAAEPDVFNHNIETVPRLFPEVRAQGSYGRSLDLLAAAREVRPGQVTKSGLIVGMGETDAEIVEVLRDLRAAGVAVVTLGQYLRPTREHVPVHRYVPPQGFEALAAEARALGFPTVYAGVFVRSSFNAEEVFHSRDPEAAPH
jgi:lipoyl synthase